ncbi:MAG: 3-hydroxyacyl-CoA dehydrogenase NAD-binding domain-containing protein, partial [Bauldia litoralis]
DGVAVLTWNIEGRPVNVMNEETVATFGAAVERALADATVKGVVVASAKDDFVAGADVEKFLEDRSLDEIIALSVTMMRITRAMETGGKPFCAAINGHALGGGFEIALGCHHRVAADNPKTRVGLPEVTLGLLPGAGGTQRMSRMLGIQKSLELLLEGRRLPVAAAHKAGLIDGVVEPEDLLAAAKNWVIDNPNARQPWDDKGFRVPGGAVQSPVGQQVFPAAAAMNRAKTWGNYPAPQAILSCVYEGLQVDIDTGLRIEAKYFANLLRDPRTKAMIKTTFFDMAAARKLKSRPEGVEKAKFSRIGILGAGMMGAGIAYVSARAGMDVVLLDETREKAQAGKARYKAQVEAQIGKGRLSADAGTALLDRIKPTEIVADLAGCDLVIEAVFEDRELKATVTRKAADAAGSAALIASNTSTLPITGLAEAVDRPEDFIGLHFFSPVERMPMVEIILGEKTDAPALARAMDYVQAIGMTPIVVRDSRGFFTSRVFASYVMEGMTLLQEGVKPALIENAAKLGGMPVGPLEVTDATSLSLLWDVRRQWKLDRGHKFEPHPADTVLEFMVETMDRPGRRAARGFYDYPAEGPKRLWHGLAEHFPLAEAQPDAETVTRRLMHIQAVEALRCAREGIVGPTDANIGSILGWGFPAITGGVISYVGLKGSDTFAEECRDLASRYGDRFSPPADIDGLLAA